MALTNLVPSPIQQPKARSGGQPAVSPVRLRRFAGAATILLAAAIATAPVALHRPLCADDLQFHLISWIDAQQGWRQGTLFPHWASSANFGAGEPRFMFYPPLTWMLGAALGMILPWALVPAALSFVLLASIGFSTRALAREGLCDAASTLAGCVALFSGYALFSAYERAAFGELCAAVWIPLLLLFALRDRSGSSTLWRRALDGSALPLAVVLACTWLSDAPGGVMASYLLAAVGLSAALLARSWFPVLRATIAFFLGMGLCAFYVLPAAYEQRWVDIQQSLGVNGDPGMRIENNWLFPSHSDVRLSLHDRELHFVSLVAVAMIGVALASVGVLLFRRRFPASNAGQPSQLPATITAPMLCLDARWWVSLALIPAVSLFLLLPDSLPVWNLLPKLRYLQFPWRWLMVVEAPMAVSFAAAVWPSARASRGQRLSVAAACGFFMLTTAAFAVQNFFRADRIEDRLSNIVSTAMSGMGFVGTDEYAPLGADNSIVATGLPDACLVDDFDRELGVAFNPEANPMWRTDQASCIATATATLRRPEHLRIAVAPTRAGFLILRLRSFPAWRVSVNGRPVTDLPVRADGLIAVPVAPGASGHAIVEVTVDWTTTTDVLLGRWLSCVSLLLLIGATMWGRRHGSRWRSSSS